MFKVILFSWVSSDHELGPSYLGPETQSALALAAGLLENHIKKFKYECILTRRHPTNEF